MTAKLTAADIRAIGSARLAEKASNHDLPKQTIKQLVSRTKSRLVCAKHGEYSIDGTPLLYKIRNAVAVCPSCSIELKSRLVLESQKKVSSTALKTLITSGGLTLNSRLPKGAVNLRSTVLKLTCTLCSATFDICGFKFYTWRRSAAKGCATCRIKKPLYHSHTAYLNALRKTHGAHIKPLFTFDPMRITKHTNGTFECSKGHTWTTKIYLAVKHGCRFCVAAERMRTRGAIKAKLGNRVLRLDSKSELLTLKRLLVNYSPNDILRPAKPQIIPGRKCNYYPDFYVRSKRTYIEVKGVATLGFHRYKGDLSVADIKNALSQYPTRL